MWHCDWDLCLDMIDWNNNCAVCLKSVALVALHLWCHKNDDRYSIGQLSFRCMKKLVKNGTGAKIGDITVRTEEDAHRNTAVGWLHNLEAMERKADNNKNRKRYDPPEPTL
jgi:hypothetical protein